MKIIEQQTFTLQYFLIIWMTVPGICMLLTAASFTAPLKDISLVLPRKKYAVIAAAILLHSMYADRHKLIESNGIPYIS